MGKQKGGRIFYETQVLKTPEAIESMFREGRLSSPSQTSGQCAIDSVTVILFYADGIRQAMWSWVFSKAPRGVVNIPDEELNPELLRTDARKLASAFLMTIGARVLRILDTEEAMESTVRGKSFSVSDESHGTTPSEVCSNLGISLARVLRYARSRVGPPGGVEIINPRARSTLDVYDEAGKEDMERMLQWILTTFLPSEISGYGNFSVGKTLSLVSSDEPIAMNLFLVQIESQENPVVPEPHVVHSASVVRINGGWYVAENEVGHLFALLTPAGTDLTPEIVSQIEDTQDVYFEVRYTSTSDEDPTPSAQYFLRDLDDNVIASTVVMPMLSRVPSLARSYVRSSIMREIYGIRPREDRIIVPGNRTILYWKPSGRKTPPPTKGTSIMDMFGAAGASGGKRKTKKKKSKKRKTSRAIRAARARPSLPK
jgi:hypothetical protein